MSLLKKQRENIARRILRRQKHRNLELPRVSVFRSLNEIFVQIIDDTTGETLVAASSKSIADVKGSKTEVAAKVGAAAGKAAVGKGIDRVYLDVGRYRYHGRIKSMVEAMREAGLKF